MVWANVLLRWSCDLFNICIAQATASNHESCLFAPRDYIIKYSFVFVYIWGPLFFLVVVFLCNHQTWITNSKEGRITHVVAKLAVSTHSLETSELQLENKNT